MMIQFNYFLQTPVDKILGDFITMIYSAITNGFNFSLYLSYLLPGFSLNIILASIYLAIFLITSISTIFIPIYLMIKFVSFLNSENKKANNLKKSKETKSWNSQLTFDVRE